MKFKNDDDSRYFVNFMVATEKLIKQFTVKEFISYLEENAEFEDETNEYIDGRVVICKAYELKEENSTLYKEFLLTEDGRIVICKAYELKEENSTLYKEFLVTEDGRVFYRRTLLDKIELVDNKEVII